MLVGSHVSPAFVGIAVGAPVGVELGIAVGVSVGVEVGVALGTGVGPAVGTGVGSFVGTFVGAEEMSPQTRSDTCDGAWASKYPLSHCVRVVHTRSDDSVGAALSNETE